MTRIAKGRKPDAAPNESDPCRAICPTSVSMRIKISGLIVRPGSIRPIGLAAMKTTTHEGLASATSARSGTQRRATPCTMVSRADDCATTTARTQTTNPPMKR